MGLLAAIVSYCLANIYWQLAHPSPLPKSVVDNPQYREMADLIDDLRLAIVLALYIGVIIGTLIYQGGNAWYYFTREKFVRECQIDQHSASPPDVAQRP